MSGWRKQRTKHSGPTPNAAIKSGLLTSKVFQADRARCTNLDRGCGNPILCILSPANVSPREGETETEGEKKQKKQKKHLFFFHSAVSCLSAFVTKQGH